MKKRFFWSTRTLRVDILDDEGNLDVTHDVLGIDKLNCIRPHEGYGDLIVRLLNKHFEEYQ